MSIGDSSTTACGIIESPTEGTPCKYPLPAVAWHRMHSQTITYPPVLIVSLNPTVQKTVVVNDFELGGVNRTSEYIFTVGGKGANASRVLRQLGHKPIYLTQAGGQLRNFFLSQLEEDGIRTEWVESNSEIRFCYTLITRDPFSASEITEAGVPVGRETEERVRRRFRELLPACGALVIAGSKSPGFSSGIYLDMMREARDLDKLLIIDLAGNELQASLRYSPDIIKINIYEFIQAFLPEADLENQNVGDSWYSPVAERGTEIYKKKGTKFVLSNGSRDTLIIDGAATSTISPEKPENVINPIGSGDAFTGGLTAGLVEKLSLRDAAAKGMECAKRNLELLKTGTIL